MARIEKLLFQHLLVGGIDEVSLSVGLRHHDTQYRFNKYWFRHSEVDGEGGGGSRTQRHDIISLVSVLEIR